MKIFLILVLFQLKHFMADYPWQTPAMLKKFSRDPDEWIPALFLHCCVHAGLTFLISVVFLWDRPWAILLSLWFAVLNGLVHFIMDRIKASPDLLGAFKPLSPIEFKEVHKTLQLLVMPTEPGEIAAYEEAQRKLLHNKFFWWALGFDQMVHHLTDILTVYLIVS